MNPQLFELYRRELQHVREMGAEFAAEYPKVAGRLGLEKLECSDPYVERLLEGFAFLAARVQLKAELSHGQLARQLLEMIYPTALSPTPSMLIAEVFPSLQEGSLADGFKLERGTRLRGQVAVDENTECDYRTSHDVTLWPIEVAGLTYLESAAAIRSSGVNPGSTLRSGLLLQLRTAGGYAFSDLPIDELSLYLSGSDGLGSRLYEQIFAHTHSLAIVANANEIKSPSPSVSLHRQGFDDDQALLPVTRRGFQGYRLIQEYFAFPERFLFARIQGLQSRMRLCQSQSISVFFGFDNQPHYLFDAVLPEHIKLNCVPAINLFPRTADRIVLDKTQHRFHVLAERTRPMNYEVYSVTQVTGLTQGSGQAQQFSPLFGGGKRDKASRRYYSLEREPRYPLARQKRVNARSSYTGSELFLSLVDENQPPYDPALRQLSLQLMCTNRDLPLHMPLGKLDTDFNLDIGAPVSRIRCLHGPTVPKPSNAYHHDAWRLVSHLNFNYLSIDHAEDEGGAAAALRQMLELYCDRNQSSHLRQLEGISSVKTEPIVRQMVQGSHLEIARGMQITLKVDETAFEGSSAYLMGAVISHFFSRHATINTFTETVLESIQRNEIERWPVTIGQRATL